MSSFLYVETDGSEAILGFHAGAIETRLQHWRPRLAARLARQLALLSPHLSGRLAAGAKGLVEGDRIRVGIFGVPYARAQDRGAFIVARGWDADSHTEKGSGARALTIHAGGGVGFARFIRIKPQHYFERALVIAPATVDRVYEEEFGNLAHEA